MIWNIIIVLVIAISLIYLVLTVYLFLKQESFIFYPTKLSPNYPFDEFPNAKEIKLLDIDGVLIHGLHFKPVQGDKNSNGIVVYYHGNAGDLSGWGNRVKDFVNRGWEVIIYDYRGYGKSTGKLSPKSFRTDAKLAMEYAIQKFPKDQIIIYGISLGTGLATKIAGLHRFKMLILETPYTSLHHLAQISFGFMPIRWLMKYRLFTKRNIRKVKSPVYIIHGTKDEQIPYEMGIKVARVKGTLIAIEGGSHNNLATFDTYQKKITEILSL